jgi:hypothetical protein
MYLIKPKKPHYISCLKTWDVFSALLHAVPMQRKVCWKIKTSTRSVLMRYYGHLKRTVPYSGVNPDLFWSETIWKIKIRIRNIISDPDPPRDTHLNRTPSPPRPLSCTYCTHLIHPDRYTTALHPPPHPYNSLPYAPSRTPTSTLKLHLHLPYIFTCTYLCKCTFRYIYSQLKVHVHAYTYICM